MKNISRKICFLIIPLLCFVLQTSCTKLEKTMLVSTVKVTNISFNTAEASGEVIDIGEGVTQHGHCYSKTSNATIQNTVTRLGAASGTGNFSSLLINLESGTLYYIKAYLCHGKIAVYGSETSFRTDSALQPVLKTNPLSSITTVSALTGGFITDDGGSPITSFGVCWDTTASPIYSDRKTTDGSGKGGFESNLIGLNASTTYYVRAYATNSKITAYGNEISFTTNAADPAPPAAATAAATSLTDTSATLNGAVIANGSTTYVTFEYGPTILYGYSSIASPGSLRGVKPVNISALLTGLKPGTIYHFRIKAVNESGTVYSNDLAFSTLQLPVVSVCSVSSIARTTATLNGKVNAVNLSTLVTIEYGTTISYGSITAPTPNPVFGVSPVYVSAGITGLTEGIAYHFRIKATSAGGTTYSGDNTFTTLQLPSVTTLSATSLTKSTASLNGTVNANNSSTVVTFEYGLSTGYGLVATASQSPVNGSSTTNVTSAIAGLTSNTKYHFRAKSVSNGGTAFGADKIFTTPKF